MRGVEAVGVVIERGDEALMHRAPISASAPTSNPKGICVRRSPNCARASATIAVSPTYRFRRVGFDGPDFLNLAVGIDTAISIRSRSIAWLHALEDRHGRRRDVPRYSSRTLDVDIVLYGDDVVHGPGQSRDSAQRTDADVRDASRSPTSRAMRSMLFCGVRSATSGVPAQRKANGERRLRSDQITSDRPPSTVSISSRRERRVANEKQDSLRDFFRRAGPFQRRAGDQLALIRRLARFAARESRPAPPR